MKGKPKKKKKKRKAKSKAKQEPGAVLRHTACGLQGSLRRGPAARYYVANKECFHSPVRSTTVKDAFWEP